MHIGLVNQHALADAYVPSLLAALLRDPWRQTRGVLWLHKRGSYHIGVHGETLLDFNQPVNREIETLPDA